MTLKSIVEVMSLNAIVMIWDTAASKEVFKGMAYKIPEELGEREVLLVAPYIIDYKLDANDGRRYTDAGCYIKLK